MSLLSVITLSECTHERQRRYLNIALWVVDSLFLAWYLLGIPSAGKGSGNVDFVHAGHPTRL